MTGILSPWYEIRCEPNCFCVYIHNPYLQRTCQWEKQAGNLSTEMAWIVTYAGRVNRNMGAGMASQTASFQLYHRRTLRLHCGRPQFCLIPPAFLPCPFLLCCPAFLLPRPPPFHFVCRRCRLSWPVPRQPCSVQWNGKEETLIAWLHIGHSFITLSFLLEGWGTANVHRMWWTFNYWTYFTYLFRSYWNKRVCVSDEKEAKQAYSSVWKQTSSSVSTELSSFMPTYVIRHNTFNWMTGVVIL